jgi:hypothetical protein
MVLAPFFIASLINFLPSISVPLIAKKILFFLQVKLLKLKPEKK